MSDQAKEAAVKMFWVRDEEVGVAVIAESKEEALAKGREELDYASAEEVEEGGLEALDEDEMEDEPTGSLTYWREIVEREVRRARAEEREACAAKVRKLADERASLAENSDTPEFYSGQAAVLRIAEEAILDRSKGGA